MITLPQLMKLTRAFRQDLSDLVVGEDAVQLAEFLYIQT